MGNRWENSGNSVRLYFLGLQNHCRGDCTHEIKRRLLLVRKVMTNLDSIFKSRDITLPTKVRLVRAMVFPVVMYGCESWTVIVLCAQAWKPGSQHAGEKRGVAGLLLGRTERAASKASS